MIEIQKDTNRNLQLAQRCLRNESNPKRPISTSQIILFTLKLMRSFFYFDDLIAGMIFSAVVSCNLALVTFADTTTMRHKKLFCSHFEKFVWNKFQFTQLFISMVFMVVSESIFDACLIYCSLLFVCLIWYFFAWTDEVMLWLRMKCHQITDWARFRIRSSNESVIS